jgi:peroxiredoxin
MQLHRDRKEFERVGVRLVVIGQGTPAHAIHFRDSHNIDLEMLVDRGRESYRAAGTKIATFSELLGPRVVAKGTASALRTRLPQQKTQGHPAQLGGVMLVMPDGSVPYSHLSDDASDKAPNDEVLAAVRRATDDQ